MNKILYLAVIAIISLILHSLRVNGQEAGTKLRKIPLSRYDSLKLSELPPLILPGDANRRLLPYAVDNSAFPWFRPIFSQESSECGQAASVGYVFTYEMDRVRQLPADLPENQYATWFSYNFINSGDPDVGVSYYESYEILKYAGNPTVAEYGSMSFGGITRWMSGYNLYYNAMHNRLKALNSVRLNTSEGIQTMKNWLFDHGDGSSSGSVGCFYASQDSYSYFPPDVPEAGKMVITRWAPDANHAMTIVGYNDSIRWDYNSDGLYTNDADIDGDGAITVSDWEIGGFIIANSYGTQWWGDDGFAYIMYKSVADPYGKGGIWNNTAVVIDVNDTVQPQLTAKVSLSHDCRNKIRITAGVAADPQATEPEYIMHFPMFDFQGGCFPVKGDTATGPIELGLDITRLLEYVAPGEPARYFLMIQENDPQGTATGSLESFSIIDYTNGATEINSMVSSLPLVNNSITTAFVNATVNYNPVEIVNDTIMPIELYASYSLQMNATGGTPPYRWHIAENYSRQDSTSVMQQIDEIELQPSSLNGGKVLIHLPFSFPFYGRDYTELYVTVDGYLMFEDNEIPWPYLIEGRTYFIETPMIAAALCNPFQISGDNEGLWYEEDGESVIFRWKMGLWGVPNGTFNATVRLFHNGRIEINYGECIIPDYVRRYIGISNGDGENYEILTYATDYNPALNQLLVYNPADLFTGIAVSPDGLLTAQVNYPMDGMPLTVCATDKNNVRGYKTFILNTTGLQMEYELQAGDDNKLEFGEEAHMNLTVTNHNDFALGETLFNFASTDQFIEIIDSTAVVNSIQPGQTVSINDAFLFTTSNDLPDLHKVLFNLDATANGDEWLRTSVITGFRPVTDIHTELITEVNNGVADPGESVGIQIGIVNSGGGDLLNCYAVLATSDPDVTILTSPVFINELNPNETIQLNYQVQISGQATVAQVIKLYLQLNGEHDYFSVDSLLIHVGVAVETFEEGNFNWLGWETGGNSDWYILSGDAHEGNMCAHSGAISDNENSWLRLFWDAAYDDTLSFWYKVESQYFYDYLRFNTLQGERGRWSGITGWKRAAIAIPAGPNIFTWMYRKNSSYSAGEDCAWLDYIIFPPLNGTISAQQNDLNPPKLWLYPNPAGDRLVIRYSLPESSRAVISIFDIHGRCVFRNEENILPAGEYTLTPALVNLKSGTYTVRLLTNNGATERKMIRSGNQQE